MYCEACGETIRAELIAQGKAPADVDDEHSYDSGDFPKGPFPDGGGESDNAEHCDACHTFLENDLTSDGIEYTRGLIIAHIESGRGSGEVIAQWREFYSDVLELPSNSDIVDALESTFRALKDSIKSYESEWPQDCPQAWQDAYDEAEKILSALGRNAEAVPAAS